jgi:hypothetical protein
MISAMRGEGERLWTAVNVGALPYDGGFRRAPAQHERPGIPRRSPTRRDRSNHRSGDAARRGGVAAVLLAAAMGLAGARLGAPLPATTV